VSTTFEPATLPLAEKERLVRELLTEFHLSVKVHYARRHELVIPCVLGPHQNQDRDPTAAVNYEKLTFKCLGCQRSGGLLWFIAEHRGGNTVDARTWLAAETGTDGQVQDLGSLLRYFDALYAGSTARSPIPTYALKTLDPWMLLHPWVTDLPVFDDQGRNVGGRGVPEDNAERFRVGYAERYFMGKDQPTSERVVIPHLWKDRLVGWQTRGLASDGYPKYHSSTDFPRDETIFNYDPDRYPDAVVVESPFSVLRHDREDPEEGMHIVSTFGANITDRQVKLLGRYERLYWWLDNDRAGWQSYQGLYDQRGRQTKVGVLEQASALTDCWVVQNDWHADPADLDYPEVVHLKQQAVPWVVWEMPRMLVCHRCCRPAHTGGCEEVRR
jgi:hypothetical protein